MPVPLLVWLGLGLLGGFAAVALNWDDIVVKLKGKRLAVLGARGVGKTRLIKFLTTGSIPAEFEYKQTVVTEKTSGRRFQLKELDLKIQASFDVSGDKAAYGEWKEVHDQADVVFYLLRADKLIAGDSGVERRVRDDLRHIGEWLGQRPQRPPFFIVGTHCDKDPDFIGLTADKFGDYVDRFRHLQIVSELVRCAGGTRQARVVLGSMKTTRDTEALVYQIFVQVTS